MNYESSKLRQYLLGNLLEEEKSSFDLHLLANREFLLQVEIAEEELIDDYIDNLLTAEELGGFEKFFLKSPQRLEQIQITKQLKEYSAQAAPNSFVAERENFRISFADKLKNKFGLFRQPSFGFMGLIIFFIILLGSSYVILRNQNREALNGNEIAEINKRDLSNLSEYSASSKLTLLPESLRGSARANALSIKEASEQVLIRLSLPRAINGETVRVNITRDNQPFLNLEKARAYSGQAANDVRILIPKSSLKAGRYFVEVTDANSTDAAANYFFDIEP